MFSIRKALLNCHQTYRRDGPRAIECHEAVHSGWWTCMHCKCQENVKSRVRLCGVCFVSLNSDEEFVDSLSLKSLQRFHLSSSFSNTAKSRGANYTDSVWSRIALSTDSMPLSTPFKEANLFNPSFEHNLALVVHDYSKSSGLRWQGVSLYLTRTSGKPGLCLTRVPVGH